MRDARRTWPLAVAALGLGLGAAAFAAPADEYPPTRPGLWRFHRTVEDPATPGSTKVIENEKCTNPVDDLQVMHQKLVQMGCKFSPTARAGNVYRFTAKCPLPDAGEAESVTVLTYHSEVSYDLVVDARGIPGSPSGKTHEELEARRLGDCV